MNFLKSALGFPPASANRPNANEEEIQADGGQSGEAFDGGRYQDQVGMPGASVAFLPQEPMRPRPFSFDYASYSKDPEKLKRQFAEAAMAAANIDDPKDAREAVHNLGHLRNRFLHEYGIEKSWGMEDAYRPAIQLVKDRLKNK